MRWQLGSHQIHLLILCLVYRGVSLPLLWHDLGKNGYFSQQEQKRLFQQAMKLYPLKGLQCPSDAGLAGPPGQSMVRTVRRCGWRAIAISLWPYAIRMVLRVKIPWCCW